MAGMYDVIELVRRFGALSKLVRVDLERAMVRMQVVCDTFYQKAVDCDYQSQLTVEETDKLEKDLCNLVNWIGRQTREAKLASAFKICMLKMFRYILCKTSRFGDVFWAFKAFDLAIGTGFSCLKSKVDQQVEFCLDSAAFFREILHRNRPLVIDLQAPLILKDGSLFLLRILWLYSQGIYDRMMRLISDHHQKQLSRSCVDHLADVCYRLAFELFNLCRYKEAIIALRYCDSLAKRFKEELHHYSLKALSLMALCYFHHNPAKYYRIILLILDRAGDSVKNQELKLRTLLSCKVANTSIADCVIKYWIMVANENPDALNQCAFMIFSMLEDNDCYPVLVELLHRIDWSDEPVKGKCDERLKMLVPRIKWLCARFAVRCCVANNYLDGLFSWLQEFAQWQPVEYDDQESILEILATAEKEAIRLHNGAVDFNRAAKWYSIVAKIAHRHGDQIQMKLLSNAIVCHFSAMDNYNLESIQEILNYADKVQEKDLQFLRFEMLVAISNGDQHGAAKAWEQLDEMYKRVVQETNVSHWKTAMETWKKCLIIAIQDKISDITVHCFDAILHECDVFSSISSDSTSLLVHVTRIHLDALSRFDENDASKIKCVDNLVKILITTYRHMTESISAFDDQLITYEFGGIDVWFAKVAWHLAQLLIYVPSYYRYQLYKVAYKFFSLATEQDEDTKKVMEQSAKLSIASCINVEHADYAEYRRVLDSCLPVIEDFFEKFSSSEDGNLIRLYEFYILCELGHVKRVRDAVLVYKECKPGKFVKDVDFFEYLAVLASDSYEKALEHILPPVEVEKRKTGTRHKRLQKLQVELSEISITCLKAFIDMLTKLGDPLHIPCITSSWQKIIAVSIKHMFLQEQLDNRLFQHCEEYQQFIFTFRSYFALQEVELFHKQLKEMISVMLGCKSRDHSLKWKQLAENLASTFPALTECKGAHYEKVFRQ